MGYVPDLPEVKKVDYEVVFYPEKNPEDEKLGATIKGSSRKYREAHDKTANMFNKKGAEYTVNKNIRDVQTRPTRK